MRAVTFQAPGEVRLDEKPDPELIDSGDAVIRVNATAVCGSDLHIFHGRHPVEPGFTIGHEYAGEVVAVGDAVTRVSVGDRVTGTFTASCGNCWFCDRGDFHHCTTQKIFGHGAISGDLQGSQADMVRVPHADVGLRRIPAGLDDEIALFAGDVMGTAVHCVSETRLGEGESAVVLGLGPVGLAVVQAARHAGAGTIVAIDSVPERLELARSLGALPVHLTEEDPRAAVKAATEGRGADVAFEVVGHAAALDSAIRHVRRAGRVGVVGVHGQRCEVHMGLLWNKALTITTGLANVHRSVDIALAAIASGELDPSPLISDRLPLDRAPEAYDAYDRHEAMKIVLTT